MSHLDEGTIVAIRDGELLLGDARAHMAECGRCRSTLVELEERAEAIAAKLGTLDGPVELERAKAAVRARLDTRWEADARRPGRLPAHLGRAAGVLLLAAGAAYAMPGSPLRDWLIGPTRQPVEAVAPTPAATGQEAASEGGIEVALAEGRVRVVLSGLAPGAPLEVVWTDRPTARIVAAAGSRYSVGEGRAEAVVAPGAVRVELPRDAASVSLEVDGRTYVRRADEGLQVLVPAAEQSAERIRFITPER